MQCTQKSEWREKRSSGVSARDRNSEDRNAPCTNALDAELQLCKPHHTHVLECCSSIGPCLCRRCVVRLSFYLVILMPHAFHRVCEGLALQTGHRYIPNDPYE